MIRFLGWKILRKILAFLNEFLIFFSFSKNEIQRGVKLFSKVFKFSVSFVIWIDFCEIWGNSLNSTTFFKNEFSCTHRKNSSKHWFLSNSKNECHDKTVKLSPVRLMSQYSECKDPSPDILILSSYFTPKTSHFSLFLLVFLPLSFVASRNYPCI